MTLRALVIVYIALLLGVALSDDATTVPPKMIPYVDGGLIPENLIAPKVVVGKTEFVSLVADKEIAAQEKEVQEIMDTMLQEVYDELSRHQTYENVTKWRLREAEKNENAALEVFNKAETNKKDAEIAKDVAKKERDEALENYNNAVKDVVKAQDKVNDAKKEYDNYVDNMKKEKDIIKTLSDLLCKFTGILSAEICANAKRPTLAPRPTDAKTQKPTLAAIIAQSWVRTTTTEAPATTTAAPKVRSTSAVEKIDYSKWAGDDEYARRKKVLIETGDKENLAKLEEAYFQQKGYMDDK
jgi:nucleoid DNA-binding protein